MRFLVMLFLLHSVGITFGQSNNPYTWLRLFGYPIFHGDVEEVFIEEIKIDPGTYESLGTVAETTYIFEAGSFPKSIYSTNYQDDEITTESAKVIYYDDQNFLLREEEISRLPVTGDKQASLIETDYTAEDGQLVATISTNDGKEYMQSVYTFNNNRFEVYEVISTHIMDNAFNSTTTFDDRWEAHRKESYTDLANKEQIISFVQMDEMGVTLRRSNFVGETVSEIIEWDEQGNPTLVLQQEELDGKQMGSVLVYTYQYR